MDLNGVPASACGGCSPRCCATSWASTASWSQTPTRCARSGQHFARDLTDAGARAVYAGLDMEMAMFDASYTRLPQAVAEGLVDEATIDLAVRRVLTAKFTAGLFGKPFVDEAATATVLGDASHTATPPRRPPGLHRRPAQERRCSAAEGARLDRGPRRPRRLAARHPGPLDLRLQPVRVGHHPRRHPSPRRRGTRVEYAPATACATRVYPSMFDSHESGTLPQTPEGFDEDAELERAVALAAESEVAVVVVQGSRRT